MGAPQLANDIEGVVLCHELRAGERARLAAIVTGAVRGNRDLPLFQLARAIAAVLANSESNPGSGLLFAFLSGQGGPPGSRFGRLETGLVDFLASMDGYRFFEMIDGAINDLANAPCDPEAIRVCAASFSRALYRYRVDHLPAERYRSKFIDINRFLSKKGKTQRYPEDGDALDFWCAEASREAWTGYRTVLDAIVSFAIAYEMRNAAVPIGSWPANDDEEESAAPWQHAETQVIASETLEGKLTAALEDFGGTTLKVLKETELSFVRNLARLKHFAPSWARSGMTSLALAPHQASIIQLEKDRADRDRIESAVAGVDGADYRSVLDHIAAILKTLDDAGALAVEFAEEGNREGDPSKKRPGGSTECQNPIANSSRLMRRKSFKALDRERLARELNDIMPALNDLRGFLRSVSRMWSARFDKAADEAFRTDRTRFAAKLAALYTNRLGV